MFTSVRSQAVVRHVPLREGSRALLCLDECIPLDESFQSGCAVQSALSVDALGFNPLCSVHVLASELFSL